MRLRITILAVVTGILALAPGAAAKQVFSRPVKLLLPPSGGGGEPSMAASPKGVVMVAGPQGIPSGVSGHGGTGLWVSTTDGRIFSKGRYIGSYLGGGDDDVIYDRGTWYEADLEAAATEVCQSTDNGKTWTGVGPVPDPSHCTTVNGGQAAPSDDRPWLTADPSDGKRVYLTYHEFVSAQPLAFRTDNGGGDDFSTPCGPIVTDPAIEQNVPQDITGGTLVARPAVDRSGNLYILFATTTQRENAQALSQGQPSGTFSQLYLAVSKDHCRTFTDHTVYDGEKKHGENTVQFGDIFNDLAIDGAGNLYVVGAGYIGRKPFASTASIYVFSSRDRGRRWSAPLKLRTPHAADMLPAAIGGPRAGQLIVGFFRTINGQRSPDSSKGKWTYSTAESRNASAVRPRFSYADVRPGHSYHNGEICNLGILCGTAPGQPSDRSLLDFTSVALGQHDCPLFVFAGNPTGKPGNNSYPPTPTNNFVTRQLTGCFTAASPGSGRHRHHVHTRLHRQGHTTHHRRHRHHRRRRTSHRPRHRSGFTG